MKVRIQPWQLAVGIVAVCAVALGVAHLWRSRQNFTTLEMFQSLPAERAVRVYVDFTGLREAGLLAMLSGSTTAQEPDYRRFVQDTGFDYVTDLDAIALSFVGDSMYAAIRGRFDWRRISGYAQAQQGRCQNTICTMPANDPNRNISFFPIRADLLALAVSAEERGVVAIGPPQRNLQLALPSHSVWIYAPGTSFAKLAGFPAGSQSFLSPLAQSRDATFSLSLTKGGAIQVLLEAACEKPETAVQLAAQFTSSTETLKKMIALEHKTPNPSDLSGILTSGHFEAQQSKLVGSWPLTKDFLESLVSGKLQ